MNVLEVAVFAMVLTAAQPQPYECVAVQPQGVNCTNGLSAEPEGNRIIKFSTGVQVTKDGKGGLYFSNGLTVFMDASAWVEFKGPGYPGLSVRRTAPARFKFSNGYTCESISGTGDMVRCLKK